MNNKTFYITTPIYYVNDRPHIGHVYTTTIADILARYHRLRGEDVFFLTGTDEHAAKVVEAARERNLTPMEWANQNAAAFKETFQKLGILNTDFIRTTEDRHKQQVQKYIKRLIDAGDVYLGEFTGWYDAGQEEYVPDKKAEEYQYISPINKKPLIQKKEKNYFFKLSKYQSHLESLLQGEAVRGQRFLVKPEARLNEVLGRIREGLNDVPISRTGTGGWGISIPGDDEHSVYVWIDALFNYLSTVQTPEDRKKYWPASVHLIAKDILWFHAVIWPALLLALNEPLPKIIYAHSFWISDGQKMSKSLGNFVDLENIDYFVSKYSLDALRWFLAKSGPIGTNDSNFSETQFIDVYNRDLANDYGNLLNRVSGLISKYFNGVIPAFDEESAFLTMIKKTMTEMVENNKKNIDGLNFQEAVDDVMQKIGLLNAQLELQAPWQQMKSDPQLAGTTLYTVAEGLRLCSVLLQPIIPSKTRVALDVLGSVGSTTTWGDLKVGTKLKEHGPLFPRLDSDGNLSLPKGK